MIRKPRLFAAILSAAFAIGGSTIHADQISDAKRAFISGMKHFDLGEFNEALGDFKDGYRAKEDPVFLYNIAQCYRALSENRDAVRYYRLYLSRASNAPNRPEIEQRIATLQAATAAEDQKRAAAKQPSAVLKASSGEEPSTHSQTTSPSAMLTAPAPKSANKPLYKKWWLWTVVGVVAAGTAVGLSVGLTRGSQSTGTIFPPAGF